MKQLKLVLLVCAVTTFVVACASNDSALRTGNTNTAATTPTPTPPAADGSPADELAAARASYNLVCIRCHKETGEGGLIDMGDGGTLKVPSFKSGHGLKHTDAQFARQIAKGGDGMPAFEHRLTPEQIGGLVRFIRREFQTGLLKDSAAPQSSH